MKNIKNRLYCLCVVVLMSSIPFSAGAQNSEWDEISNLISKYYGQWSDFTYSGLAGNNRIPNTALLGNGDIGVVSGGDEESKTFYVSKGDFWTYNGSPVPIGGITIGPVKEDDEDIQNQSLALNASVTASATHPNFPASRMISGQWALGYEGWVSDVNVNAATNPFWVELDLKETKTFNRIIVRHDAAARPSETANVTRDFSVSVRNNSSDSWIKILNITGNNKAITDELLSDEVTARYIRLEITKGTQETTDDSKNNPRARIGQFELYLSDGSEITPPPTPGNNKMTEKQDILNAQIVSSYQTSGLMADMRAVTVATDNYILVHITSTAEEDQEIAATLWAKADNASFPVTTPALLSGNEKSITVTRTTPNSYTSNAASHKSQAAMTAKLIGVDYTTMVRKNGKADLIFTLPAGKSAWLVVAVGGGGRTYDNKNQLIAESPIQQAANLLSSVKTQADVETLLEAHHNWWENYWQASYIQLDASDAKLNTLMKYYYAAQYALGCNIREGKVAPGLYGLWHITDDPSWKSDYHLNYNFISTFYGVSTSNRVYQSLPAIEAILQYVENGKQNASTVSELRKVRSDFVTKKIQQGDIDSKNGIADAVLYPVGIGPWGMTLDASYHNEALNATFSAYPMIEYYNYTLDNDFLENVLYDYLKLCVGFYEKWLENEDGKQILYAGYNEGSWSINPAVELSVLKSALHNLIRASEILEQDAEKRLVWQNILDNLSPQPTAVYQNKTVFTLAEKEWVSNQWKEMSNPVPGDGNIIPMEAVIPGEQLGYYSSAEQLAVAKNTIDVFSGRGAWGQNNNFPKIFPVAVNTRYPIQTVIDNLASTINGKIKANLMIEDNTHGIEKAGATEAINNMMLLSDQGVVKVFPGWIKNRNAKFVRLREKGAFVISAEYSTENQEVSFVEVLSEAGQKFTIASPWTEGIMVSDSDDKRIPVTKGFAPNHSDEATYAFDTQIGKSYRIVKSDGSAILSVKSKQTALVYPNPVEAGKTVSVITDDCYLLEEYDLHGRLLRAIPVNSSVASIQAADKSGIYMYLLKMNDGSQRACKIVVK